MSKVHSHRRAGYSLISLADIAFILLFTFYVSKMQFDTTEETPPPADNLAQFIQPQKQGVEIDAIHITVEDASNITIKYSSPTSSDSTTCTTDHTALRNELKKACDKFREFESYKIIYVFGAGNSNFHDVYRIYRECLRQTTNQEWTVSLEIL